jgi:putative cardiolipin synthase
LIDRAADERSHRVRWNGSRLTWERREGDRIVVLEDEPDTTAWRRLLSDLLWIVAPETSL